MSIYTSFILGNQLEDSISSTASSKSRLSFKIPSVSLPTFGRKQGGDDIKDNEMEQPATDTQGESGGKKI